MHTLDAATSPLNLSAIAYPPALIEILRARFGLTTGHAGVVVTSGSDRLPELFRRQGEQITVIGDSPAHTGLPDASADFLAADRVLFSDDQDSVRQEFRRILRHGAPVILITDNRVYSGSEQQEAYEALLRAHCAGFREKRVPYDIGDAVNHFFRGGQVFEDAFIGRQAFSRQEFLNQAAALSIYPQSGDRHRPILEQGLSAFFERWNEGGVLHIPTVCRVAYGHLG